MKPDKKKDNLTDLVSDETAESNQPASEMSNGQVTANDGNVVTLGVDDKELTELARKLIKVAKAKAKKGEKWE